jgi:hypothetical protein
MPMFRAFDSWSICGRLANSTASDKNRGTHKFTQVWPPGGERPISCLSDLVLLYIVGAITMVRRWDLAMVERDGMC